MGFPITLVHLVPPGPQGEELQTVMAVTHFPLAAPRAASGIVDMSMNFYATLQFLTDECISMSTG